MRKLLVIIILVLCTLSLVHLADARKRKRTSDKGVPIVSAKVCSDLCRGNETIYVYQGITDPQRCAEIGGEMYSHQGWELNIVCKVMNKRRCKQYDGRMGEFHFPFQAKNYTHLGCVGGMAAKECRALLRTAYASKPTPNKYFMNNIGCMAH